MWTKDTIEVKRIEGRKELWQVERYGLWALARQPAEVGGAWSILHIPTGLSLPYGFFVERNARKAVEAISAVRNDWDLGTELNIKPHEIAAVVEICRLYDGINFVNIQVGEMEALNRDIVRKVMD